MYIKVYMGGYYDTFQLDPPARMWLTGDGQEIILISSQFLYLVARAIDLFLDIEPANRTQNMNDLIALYSPVIVNDHYWRWIYYDEGAFQVQGWGCSYGRYNHYQFLQKKFNREFGGSNALSYCNAVVDTDMWILAGLVEMLAANGKDPQLVPIDDEKKQRFLDYVSLGCDLLNSRLTES